jgi:hypothetical protein
MIRRFMRRFQEVGRIVRRRRPIVVTVAVARCDAQAGDQRGGCEYPGGAYDQQDHEISGGLRAWTRFPIID